MEILSTIVLLAVRWVLGPTHLASRTGGLGYGNEDQSGYL